MTRARLSLAALTLGAATLALPPAAQAARDFSRGNVQAVDWNAMQIALDEHEVKGQVRAFLDARFAEVADFLRNA